MANLPSEVVRVTLRRYMRAAMLAAVALVALAAAVLVLGAVLPGDPTTRGSRWPTAEFGSTALFVLLGLAVLARRARIANAALLLALLGAGSMLASDVTDMVTMRTLAATMLLSLSGLLMTAGRLPRIRSILVTTGALMGPTGVTYLLVTSRDVTGAPGIHSLGLLSAVLTILAAFALTSLAPSGAPAVVLRTYPIESTVMLAAGVVMATPAVHIIRSGSDSVISAQEVSGITVLVVLALGLPWLGWFALRVESWRAVAVSGTDAVMVLERSGRIESVDIGTEQLTGWKPCELRGVDLATMLHDTTTDLHQRLDDIANSMTTSVMDDQPIRLRGPMGTEVDVSIRLLPTITADGLRIIATLTDAGREVEYRRRALQDHLTGVLNRRGLFSELERDLREPSSGTALMFVDLDHFKQINDLASHAAGDEALRHVAKSLQSTVRAGDRVGRVGGDEFVCVLSGIRDHDDLLAAAGRLEAELSKLTIDTMAGPTGITVSIGAAIAEPGCTSQALLARADAALLEAKRAGRNRIVVAGNAETENPAEDRVVVDARTGTASIATPGTPLSAPLRRGGDPRRDQLASTDSRPAGRP